MLRNATILKVFLSSPSDVVEERELLNQVIQDINGLWGDEFGIVLQLVMWETHTYPDVGTDPQSVINRQIGDDYDVFVGIMWTRLGTPTGRALSGTVEEFERAYRRYLETSAQISIMFYFREPPTSSDPEDLEQYARIEEFRRSISERGVFYRAYSMAEDFRRFVSLDLIRQVQSWRSSGVLDIEPVTQGVARPEELVERFVEFMEVAQQNFREVTTTDGRLLAIFDQLSTNLHDRTQELYGVPQVDSPINEESFRRILNHAAADLNHFAIQLLRELPAYNGAFGEGIDAVIRASTLLQHFGDTGLESANDLLTFSRELRESVQSNSGPIASLEAQIDGLSRIPNITPALVQARENGLEIIDDFAQAVHVAVELISESITVLEEVISSHQDHQG